VTRSRGPAVSAHTIPAESLESDGTLEWSSTTIIIVEAAAGVALKRADARQYAA
jgi:hypothetical protein